MILAPDANIYFNINQVRRNAGDKGLAVGERVVLIVARDNESYRDLTPESFYPIGISGEIKEINSQGYVVIHTSYRVDVDNIEIGTDDTIRLTMTRRSDIDDMSRSVEKEKLDGMLEEMRRFASGFEWADSAEYWLKQIDSLERAACVMSPWMDISNAERYAILAEDSRTKRAELIEEALYGFMEVLTRCIRRT